MAPTMQINMFMKIFLGLFDKPQPGEVLAHSKQQLPITLIFDSLKDPGNAGTLIRSAAAVGCERIITTKGCEQ